MENIQNNPEFLRRLTLEWTEITKEEKIEVENLSGVFYAFGSELACLRLYKYYKGIQNVHVDYFDIRQTWYFCLEPKN